MKMLHSHAGTTYEKPTRKERLLDFKDLIHTIALFYFLISSQIFASDPELRNDRAFVETPLTESDRDHWSFQPIANPFLPTVQNLDWPANEIDYFILAGMEASKLQPASRAERPILLRRLKLDLLGLPPTIEELDDFESDSSEDAYEQRVDRFLASPRFGERRAQKWLDLARFAETDGFEHDRVRKEAWQFRDWVIGAMNGDMPYDQFIFKQLAGESDADPSQHIATMFCFAGPDIPDINDQELRRHHRLNELTSTVGSALLGLHFHCAQCHDHKSDPISQADFYRLRAVFEPSVPEFVREKPLLTFTKESTTVPARFYFRGELQQPGPIVQAAMPRIAIRDSSIHYCDTSNPRAEFATWLFQDDHPLTARVIVNRLWQSHFGRGLFDNPSDVGVAPAGPTHPELLDWLATELRRNQWCLKALQRKIVLSSTYRQRSFPEKGDTTWQHRRDTDPKNRLYSRFPRHRIDAEVIRDSMLAVAGQINFKSGGEGVMPPLPNELVGTLLKGQWKTSEDEAEHWRRSVYVFARRNLRYPIFESFDRPDAGASCPKRDLSTTAIQSLQMFNSELSLECSKQLRQSLLADILRMTNRTDLHEMGSVEKWIVQLFRTTFARRPTASEVDTLIKFIGSNPARRDDQLLAACLAIFNTSEFVYVD